jgi:mono/diheme cytochrome c family protein
VRRWIALLVLMSAATAARAYSPETNYTLHCQGCHLADGTASADKVPALAGSVAQFLRVPEGRAFLVRVPGVANAQLADADLAALLDWTLRRFDAANLPADFVPYTAEEVHRLRAEPLVDIAPARNQLLDAIERER